jgi:hypothetical protein
MGVDFSELDRLIDKKIEFDKTHPSKVFIIKGKGLTRIYGTDKEINEKLKKIGITKIYKTFDPNEIGIAIV